MPIPVFSADEPLFSPVSRGILAGSAAGVASTLVCHPLDAIRTRIQSSGTVYSGVLDCLSRTVRAEGPRSLYKGLSAPLLAQAVYKSVIFGSNSALHSFAGSKFGDKEKLRTFVFGAASGAVNAFVVTPVELIRNRLIVDKGKSPLGVVEDVLRRKGISGMWRGLSSTICRDSTGVGCWFLGFEMAKHAFRSTKKDSEQALSYVEILISGSVGGISFWTVALPFDSIKSVIQVSDSNTSKSMIRVGREIIQSKGFMYLYRAWPVAFGRGIPGAAVTLSTHDYVLKFLQNF